MARQPFSLLPVWLNLFDWSIRGGPLALSSNPDLDHLASVTCERWSTSFQPLAKNCLRAVDLIQFFCQKFWYVAQCKNVVGSRTWETPLPALLMLSFPPPPPPFHVAEGFGEQAALIWDSSITRSKHTVPYAKLQDKAGGRAGPGEREGGQDADILHVHGHRGCPIRCLWVFPAKELAARIRHAEPTVTLSASCGVFKVYFFN